MKTPETNVLTALIRRLAKKGWVPVVVFDGEEQNGVTFTSKKPQYLEPAKGQYPLLARKLTTRETLAVVDSVDEATIHFAPANDINDWGHNGVLVVLGNGGDGSDCIADYHCHDDFDAVTDSISEDLSNGKRL